MFGIRNDNRSTSQRALVPVTEPLSDDVRGDEDVNDFEGSPASSYSGLIQFARRRKGLIAFVAYGILLFVSLMIATICVTARGNSAPIVNPTTPAPTTLPTTTTVPTTTTTTPTTTTSTTTPSTTTSTTPSTTTSTTPSTTTSTTPSTTTSTTPSTTTSTTPSTTTSTTPSTTTTTLKPSHLPTTRPLPAHPESLPASTLLHQIGLTLNWTNVPCAPDPESHPTFKYILRIQGVPDRNFTGESTTKKHAQSAASSSAVMELFGVKSNDTIPPPPHECKPQLSDDTLISLPTEPNFAEELLKD